MRVLLGWLMLCGFVAALAWVSAEKQKGSAEQVSDESPGAPGLPARIVIGIPSGAEPLGVGLKRLGRAERREVVVTPAPTPPVAQPAPKIFKLEVRAGSTLSTMCQELYTQEDRPPLAEVVEAVARWNQLKSPDSLVIGQGLELPPLELLFPE